jgi:hypothetical protein
VSQRTPPFPDKDLAEWARQLYNYLAGESLIKSRIEPTSILLAHKVDTVSERAAVDGLMLFDPALGKVVVSVGGVFVPIGPSGGTGTDLDYAADDRLITSSTGLPATLPIVTSVIAGLMSSTMLATLDSAVQPAELPVVPEFASFDEAKEGTATDKIMSPALVRSLSGVITNNLNGVSSGGFIAPEETTEFVLFFNGQTAPANGNPRILFNGSDTVANSRAFSSRQRFSGTTLASAGDDGVARDFRLDANTSNIVMVGQVRGVKDDVGMWSITGSLRFSPTVRVDLGGMIRVGATSWPLVIAVETGVWTDPPGFKLRWRI